MSLGCCYCMKFPKLTSQQCTLCTVYLFIANADVRHENAVFELNEMHEYTLYQYTFQPVYSAFHIFCILSRGVFLIRILVSMSLKRET